MADREHILSEIRRTAEQNGGKPLGRNRFFAETGIREADWLGRYWARWGDAVKEAGFEPNTMQSRFDDDQALNLLAHETRRLGHLPTIAEHRMRRRTDPAYPSDGVFRRMGSKAELAARLADYCKQDHEFADVLEIISPLLKTAAASHSDDEPGEPSEDGFVYLLKSGRHYKLGRTNAMGRREYELAIQLPERAVKVHAIKTDDPVGIEGYWHTRFADRRTNGEWFELTKADVKAFKRRKFM